MNMRFLSSMMLCLSLSFFVCAQEMPQVAPPVQEIGRLACWEQTLRKFWSNIWHVSKKETQNVEQLSERTVAATSGFLGFWDNHPKITKGLIGSAAVIGLVRSQQYISMKENLDKARYFCAEELSGTAEPQGKAGWLEFDLDSTNLKNQLDFCKDLIKKLASSSWLKEWEQELFAEYNNTTEHQNAYFTPNVSKDHEDYNAYCNNLDTVLRDDRITRIIEQRAQALGCPQYYAWSRAPRVWSSRIAAMCRQPVFSWAYRLFGQAVPERDQIAYVGFWNSLVTGLLWPYEGEATLLTRKLQLKKKQLKDRIRLRQQLQLQY